MRHFPVFLDLRGRHVLVLGGGEVARRKAEPLQRAGAEVRFAARFEPRDLHGCALAVGADAAEAELHALSAAARAAGVPVNIVDQPELCSFIMPAIVDRDPVTIAISSGGTAPVLARLLRARIEAVVPPAFGRLATLADSFKAEIRRRLPDLAQRRRVLERLLTGRAADLTFAGRDTEARAEFAAVLAGAEPSPGIVYLVAIGPGAPDLLTLRALRLLGEADVIVHDATVSQPVLDTARRDAERIVVETEAGAVLIALARAGRKVVRLTDSRAEAALLSAAGVLCEIVPGVSAA